MVTRFSVVGQGRLEIYLNGSLMETATSTHEVFYTFAATDIIEVRAYAESGWTLEDICGTQCLTAPIQQFTGANITWHMTATFIQGGGGSGITNLSVVPVALGTTGVTLNIHGSGAGNYRITDNGIEIYSGYKDFSTNGVAYNITNVSGTHNYCVEAI